MGLAWVGVPLLTYRKESSGNALIQNRIRNDTRTNIFRRSIKRSQKPNLNRRIPPRASVAPQAAPDPLSGRDGIVDTVNEPLGPAVGNRYALTRWGEGIRDDIRRRAPLYLSDWKDGFDSKTIPTVLFLYCACLAPVVAFGGLTASLTGGSMGVIEFLLSSGGVGMLYATISGQPLTFLAPTGLTLAFTVALYNYCGVYSLPFLATYAWVGIWTSLILLFLAICNSSDLIKYCTRFTDDIFNSLIATNFIYEACRSLGNGFYNASSDKTRAFTAVALAVGTVLSARALTGLRAGRYFWKQARTFLSDFGPVLTVALMSAITLIPAVAGIGLPKLQIPATFSLAGGRSLFIPLLATPLSVRIAAIVPALLLTCLFFLDQNISVRVVNAPHRMLKKGPAYHLDMFALAISTALCAVTAMPLMCAGTLQSLAHISSLSRTERINGEERIVSVVENRLTPFLIHALIFGSLFLLPVIQLIPMAVINGLFLFLGFQMFDGNAFLSRIPYLFMDPSQYPERSPMSIVPAIQVHTFTLLQMGCLAVLWALKLNKKTSMFFPAVIGCLMFVRSSLAQKMFPASTLKTLDSDIGVGEETTAESDATAKAQ